VTSELLQCVEKSEGRAMLAQPVSRQSPAADARLQFQAISRGICCGQNGTGTGSSSSTSVLSLSVSFHQ